MHSYSARDRRGFVLLMVLLIISLAAIALAGLARKSFLLANEAAEAQQDLQRRWGTISCRRVLLDRAEEIIGHAAGEIIPEPASVWGEFSLGRLHYSVVLADEDAKANVNSLLKHDPDAAHRVLYTAQRQADRPLEIRLRIPPESEELKPVISWGQVFDLASESAPRVLPEATAGLTLWGNGRLNLRRAPDEAVQQVCGLVLSGSDLGELLGLRQEVWTDAEQLINKIGLDRKQRGAVRRLVSERSNCYSMWLSIESVQRTWTSLEIAHPGTGTPYLTFAW